MDLLTYKKYIFVCVCLWCWCWCFFCVYNSKTASLSALFPKKRWFSAGGSTEEIGFVYVGVVVFDWRKLSVASCSGWRTRDRREQQQNQTQPSSRIKKIVIAITSIGMRNFSREVSSRKPISELENTDDDHEPLIRTGCAMGWSRRFWSKKSFNFSVSVCVKLRTQCHSFPSFCMRQ